MSRVRAPLTSMLAILLTAAAVSGCGGGSDPQSVVKTYLNALANGDGKTACAQLDLAAVNRLLAGAANGSSCPALLNQVNKLLSSSQKQALQNAQVASATTNGNTATVKVTVNSRTRTVRLTNSNGKWLISGGSTV